MKARLHRLLIRMHGWLRLIVDTVSQRYLVRGYPVDHPIFKKDTRLLAGKTAIVTGANSGLGFETARWLAEAGATVVLACRNLKKAETAKGKITDLVPGSSIVTMELDLSNLLDVRAFVDRFKDSGRELHILVLNAGIMSVPHELPEKQFMVNHVAHSLFAILLVPLLQKSSTVESHSRIIIVSSIASLISDFRFDDISYRHRRYSPFQAYANSKLCNILFTYGLSNRCHKLNIDVNAIHPGESQTEIARHMNTEGHEDRYRNYVSKMLLTARESAMTILYAAGAPELENVSGNVFERVNRKMAISSKLTMEEDVQRLWEVTLSYGKILPKDTRIFSRD